MCSRLVNGILYLIFGWIWNIGATDAKQGNWLHSSILVRLTRADNKYTKPSSRGNRCQISCDSTFWTSLDYRAHIASSQSPYNHPRYLVVKLMSELGVDHIDSHPDALRNQSPSPPTTGSPPELHIPEASDGFFGYNEEKSLAQVRRRGIPHFCLPNCLPLPPLTTTTHQQHSYIIRFFFFFLSLFVIDWRKEICS